MNDATRTYYDVLGVSQESPLVVIKAAFRALAKEYHPDSGSEAASDPERFIELQDAYATLSDDAARNAYDAALREALAAGQGEAAPQPAAHPSETALQVPVVPESGALTAVHARLMLYSEELAAGFREAVQAGRSEEELLAFAEHIEEQFLKEYFGEEQDVRVLAKLLLLRCRKAAVLELNELLGACAGLPAAARRRALADFLERHFRGETLLLPWLRERFAPPRAVQPMPVAAVARPARRESLRAPAARPHTLRSVVKVFCWSCAMYFGIIFVSAVAG